MLAIAPPFACDGDRSAPPEGSLQPRRVRIAILTAVPAIGHHHETAGRGDGGGFAGLGWSRVDRCLVAVRPAGGRVGRPPLGETGEVRIYDSPAGLLRPPGPAGTFRHRRSLRAGEMNLRGWCHPAWQSTIKGDLRPHRCKGLRPAGASVDEACLREFASERQPRAEVSNRGSARRALGARDLGSRSPRIER